MVATVHGPSMLLLFDHLRACGHDPNPLVQHFGVDLAHFEDPEVWVPVSLTDQIWERAAVLYADPNLGLHVAATLRAGNGGVLSYLATYSADLQAAIERLIRYFPLVSQATRYRMTVGKRVARIIGLQHRPCVGRQPEELLMAIVVLFARRICGPSVRPIRARFRSGPPPCMEEHHALFGDDIAFRASGTWIELPIEMLRLPVQTADEQLADLLEVAADRAFDAPPGNLSARVGAHIAELLSSGKRALCEDVARRMGLSPRTLRRRLAEDGASYRAVHDGVLSNLAGRLLTDDAVPLNAVVERLQFSDVRALSNATRRWFGLTPQQYRRLNGNRPPG